MAVLKQWALVTLNDFKDHLRGDIKRHGENTTLERFIMRATNLVEELTYRELVFRGTSTQWAAGEGLTEFHTIDASNRFFIYALQEPINAVSLFVEDTSGSFNPGTVFVEDSDFRVHKKEGKIIKISGGGTVPVRFFHGIDVLKLIYSAGYLNTPTKGNVPEALHEACLEIATLMWREADRKEQGIKSRSAGTPQGMGSTTRFDPKKVPEHVMEMLEPFVRWGQVMDPTGRAA